MARRHVPKRPPIEAQQYAFKAFMKNRLGGAVFVSELNEADLDLLAGWLLRWLPEAAELSPARMGKPPDWAMKLAAVEHLRSITPAVKLSDAPGSICVRELNAFLNAWHAANGFTGKRKQDSVAGAAELAGTLVAMVQSIRYVNYEYQVCHF